MRETIKQMVIQALHEEGGIIDGPVEQAQIEDMGLDSMSMLNLLAALEDKFDIEVRCHEWLDLDSVREIIALVEHKIHGPARIAA